MLVGSSPVSEPWSAARGVTWQQGRESDRCVVTRESGTTTVVFPRGCYSTSLLNERRFIDPTVICVLDVPAHRGGVAAPRSPWQVMQCSPQLFLAERRLMQSVAYDPLIAAGANELVLEALGGCSSRLTPPLAAAAQRHCELVEHAKQRIAATLGQRLTFAALSAELGCTPFHLSRTYRALEGMTLAAYRNQLRLRAAVDRLPGLPSGTLTELALELGFSSHSHFTDAFRRNFALTPSEYLNDLRAAPLAY
jgi:AraC-like DNA-binding protein